MAYASSKMASIRDFKTKEHLGEFDKSESFAGVALTADSHTTLLADCAGNIFIYDINVNLSAGKVLKVKKTLSLPPNEKIKVFDIAMNDKERQSVRQTLLPSPRSDYVIACYKGVSLWEAFLWSLIGNGSYIGRVCENRTLTEWHPRFSFDGQFVINVFVDRIQILFSRNGLAARTYRLQQTVRSFQVSETTLEMTVLTGKDVLVLSVDATGQSRANDKHNTTADRLELLAVERHSGTGQLQPSVELVPQEAGFVDAVERSAAPSATDQQLLRLNSARNNRPASDAWFSPSRQWLVQLHSRIQIIDLDKEEIIYSPRSGDCIHRPTKPTSDNLVASSSSSSSSAAAGQQSVQVISLSQLLSDATQSLLEVQLMPGDRVVSDGNKVRLRVPHNQHLGHTQGQSQGQHVGQGRGGVEVGWRRLIAANVSSVIVVSVKDDNAQFTVLHRITAYQVSSRRCITYSKCTRVWHGSSEECHLNLFSIYFDIGTLQQI